MSGAGPGPDKQVAIELASIAKSLTSIAKSQKEIVLFLKDDVKKFMDKLERKIPPPRGDMGT